MWAKRTPSGGLVLASSGYVPLHEAQDLQDQGNGDTQSLCPHLTHQTSSGTHLRPWNLCPK